MLSNSFSRVISHAREEYLYVYSVYVLEASTSNRLTHFYPPFNLLALALFRPLRLFLPSNKHIRAARILLLKATHLPIVGAILLYELVRGKVGRDDFAGFKGPLLLELPPPPAYNNTNNNNGSSSAAGTGGDADAGPQPRRQTSRQRLVAMRPVSSSSSSHGRHRQQQQQYQQQHQQRQRSARSANRMSLSTFEPLPAATRVASIRPFSAGAPSSSVAAAARSDAATDDVDAPTEMEVKISELSGKIERLTEIILAMQSERDGSQG